MATTVPRRPSRQARRRLPNRLLGRRLVLPSRLCPCLGVASQRHARRLTILWKRLAIDNWHANAQLACRHPVDQLKENLEQGKKLRFCYGKLEGAPAHCCGG